MTGAQLMSAIIQSTLIVPLSPRRYKRVRWRAWGFELGDMMLRDCDHKAK